MKAIVVSEPEVLRLEEMERRERGRGVLIEVTLAGVNFADVEMRAGMMGGPHAVESPYTPGFETVGVVAASPRRSGSARSTTSRWGGYRRPAARLGCRAAGK